MEKCYVLTDFDGPTRLVGLLEHEPGTYGRFTYARSFTESERAFSLDPLNLPIAQDSQEIASVPYLFGAILDAGPDDWGRRSLAYRGKPAAGIAPLVYGSGSGVGSLLFSYSRDAVKPRPALPTLNDLQNLFDGAREIERGHVPPAHIMKLLDAGTSMGGARPKAVIQDRGKAWLAKFPSSRDVLDQPLIECATLKLAHLARLTVPDHRIVEVGGRNVLLVERFDMSAVTGNFQHRHYLSMAALLTVGRRLRPDAVKKDQSYMGIASVLASYGENPKADQLELFRRMAFNVLMGHVDDHQRNHGFLMNDTRSRLRLAPVFDVAPSNGTAESVSVLRDVQAIGIGSQNGALRTIENLLSSVEDFGLNQEEARSEFEDVRSTVLRWEEVFLESGVSRKDCDLVRHRIDALESHDHGSAISLG